MEFGLSALREQIAVGPDGPLNVLQQRGVPMPTQRPTGTDVPPHRKLRNAPQSGGPSDVVKIGTAIGKRINKARAYDRLVRGPQGPV